VFFIFQGAFVGLQFQADVVLGNESISNQVVFAFAPSLLEISESIEKVSSDLPSVSLDVARSVGVCANVNSDEFFQDSFGPIVLVAAWQICIDLYYMALFFFVMLAPWRFYELMCSLMQSDEQYFLRVARHAMKLKRERDRYLAEFREKFIPLLNEYSKNVLITTTCYEHSWYHRFASIEFAKLRSLEKYTYGRFAILYFRIFKRLKNYERYSGSSSLSELNRVFRLLFAAQHTGVDLWGLRAALHYDAVKNEYPMHVEAASIEVINRLDRENVRKEKQLEGELGSIMVSIENKSHAKQKTSIKAMLSRPIEESRFIVLDMARATAGDYGVVVLFLLMMLTVVSLPGLIGDLWKHRNSSTHSWREIVLVHCKRFMDLKTKILLLVIFSLGVCCLFVGLPAYIEKLPRCNSLDECIDLARETIK
jgi:hypothetical protein